MVTLLHHTCVHTTGPKSHYYRTTVTLLQDHGHTSTGSWSLYYSTGRTGLNAPQLSLREAVGPGGTGVAPSSRRLSRGRGRPEVCVHPPGLEPELQDQGVAVLP